MEYPEKTSRDERNPDAHVSFHNALAARRKKLSTAYALLIFLGIIGAHRKYLGDDYGARNYAVGSVVPLSFVVAGIIAVLLDGLSLDLSAALGSLFLGWALMAVLFTIALICFLIADAFQLPSEIKKLNLQIEQQLAAKEHP